MTAEARTARTYTFPRPDHRALLLGLRFPQVVVLAITVVLAVAVVVAIPDTLGLAGAIAMFCVGVPAAVARVRGRTLHEWVPVLGAWVLRRRQRQWVSPVPLLGDLDGQTSACKPPAALAGVSLLKVTSSAHGEVGVVKDSRAGTWTAVVECRGRAFGLLDADEQERLTGLWGQTLAAFAHEGSPVSRIAWVKRTVPEEGDALDAYLADEATLPADHDAHRSYAQLIGAAGPVSHHHETYLVLSIGADRARRAIRQAGGGDPGGCEVLLREVTTLLERLRQAEIETTGVLGPRRLSGLLRTCFDPVAIVGLARRARVDPDSAGAAARNAWPLATSVSWDRYRTDSGVHATYWVSEWPRRPVPGPFLHPLLLRPSGLHAMAVVFEPVPPSRATRAVESAHAAHVADEELRNKAGYLTTARRQKEYDQIREREAELADGHAEYRFSGYLTVSATDDDALDFAVGEIEQLGFDAQVELRRLHGQQDHAFTYTLPLGRGLTTGIVPTRPAHRATTATIQALYPFMAGHGLGSRAAYIGQELYGGAFCFDPWNLYADGRLTNPNLLVAGRLGLGKSSLVKTLLWRGAVFGRQAAVLDPKGEYGPLAAALGVEPIRLRPGGDVRLNPLDPGPGADQLGPDEVKRRRLSLLQSIATAALKRDLRPIERAACRIAVDAVASGARAAPTLPDVAAALLDPSGAAAEQIRTTAEELARGSHDVALELRRLCEGDLRGMFDGPSTIDVDWDGPLVVVDLSEVADEEGLAILMACATAWIQAAVVRPGAGQRYIVLDEGWRLLHHLGTARWLRASLKLARQYGVANMIVLHRLSDLLAAGDEGSEQRELAKGLLSDTETRIIYAQSENEIGATAEMLGLSRADQNDLPTLPQGVALWKVGRTTHVVSHHLGQLERALIDTDGRMIRRQAAA